MVISRSLLIIQVPYFLAVAGDRAAPDA